MNTTVSYNWIAKVLTAAFLCLILFLVSAFPCQAAQMKQNEKRTVIKVAFYPLDGFFEYDEHGNETGYGVDYLNELKKYANIDWEYVPADSWEGIMDMLVKGEADVRMPVSEPTDRKSSYSSFSTEPILLTYHAIMSKKDRTDLFYKDYKTFPQMRIGVTKNLVEKTDMNDYLNSIGILNHLVYFEDYNSCRAALENGTIDALISNVMDLTEDMKILDKFCISKTYITTLKDSPYYSLINQAMTELALDNPSFQNNLNMKYFPERVVEPFTKEETEYIEKTKEITIGVYPDRKPVSFYNKETDRFEGVAIDIADILSKYIGLTFRYVPITTKDPRDMLNTIDLIMPVTPEGTDSPYFTTPSIVQSKIMLIVQAGSQEPLPGEKVGVLSKTFGIRNTLQMQEKWEIISYDTNKDALKALQKGEISAFANSSFVVNWLLENPRYENFRILHYQSLPIEFCICGNEDNKPLQSILTKGIHSITDEEKDQIIAQNITFSMSDLTLLDKLYLYRSKIIMTVVFLCFILAAMLFYNHSRSKYILEIKKKGDEQEKANLAKTEFLSRMSHDMRTPMNGILGLTYLMEDQTEKEEIRQALYQQRSAGNYLLQLINDVLDVNKVESPDFKLNPVECSEEHLFLSIISMIKPQIEQKSIVFHFEPVDIDWSYTALDEQRVKQIFINLLSNSIKFTPEGGRIDFMIEKVSQDEQMIRRRFIIRDTGIGMGESFLPKAFDAFSQENRSEEGIGGTGLGLSIVKNIVERMGGSIHVKSKQNEGTEFTLYLNLPLAKNKTPETLQAETPDSLSFPPNLNILLCEDHPLNAEIATKLLEKKDAEVTWKENGKFGLNAFQQSDPGYFDVILMDIRMPVMDGLSAASAIRTLDRLDAKTIPIIAMTANAFEEDIQKSKEAGMNAHIAKPIIPSVLYGTIAKEIQDRSL